MSQDDQIEKLLGDVMGAQDELVRVEEEYKKSKLRAKEQLTTAVHRLAELVDSQAVRARILRELYWKRRVSAEAIGGAFKMGMRRVSALAGSYTVTQPCDNRCGGTVEKIFTSRTDLERHERSGLPQICAQCSKREREAEERERAQGRREDAERVAELRAMSWQEFTDTPEWITLRNHALGEVGFKCEICKTPGAGLTVCLHKDTVEYPLPSHRLIFFGFGGGDARFYVLCRTCLNRCADLLHPEWRESLKAEFVARIKRDFSQL